MRTWYGVIVIVYKPDPLEILIIENKETGRVTAVSGALEEGESLEQAAIRELMEEIGWDIEPEQLQITEIKQEFIYSPQKKERAGDKGINQVLLLNANGLPEPQETTDAKNARYVSLEESLDVISFDDLKDIIKQAAVLTLYPQDNEK